MGKKKLKSSLLSHERALVRCGKLQIQEPLPAPDQTDECDHDNDDIIWLYATEDDGDEDDEENDEEGYDNHEYGEFNGPQNENPLARSKCYRTMADDELLHLIEHNEMPSTLPFQTIFHGLPGMDYCASRLMEKNNDDTNQNSHSCRKNHTTVVEFDCDENFVDRLFIIQCKVVENQDSKKKQEEQDVAILTHSLGFRASRTLVLLNDALKRGDITWRIILVKRPMRRERSCRKLA
jgi:hypothetical protein